MVILFPISPDGPPTDMLEDSLTLNIWMGVMRPIGVCLLARRRNAKSISQNISSQNINK